MHTIKLSFSLSPTHSLTQPAQISSRVLNKAFCKIGFLAKHRTVCCHVQLSRHDIYASDVRRIFHIQPLQDHRNYIYIQHWFRFSMLGFSICQKTRTPILSFPIFLLIYVLAHSLVFALILCLSLRSHLEFCACNYLTTTRTICDDVNQT